MSIIIGIDHGYYAIKTAHCSFYSISDWKGSYNTRLLANLGWCIIAYLIWKGSYNAVLID